MCEQKNKGGNMLNQIVIVGRLVDRPIVEENENGRKVSKITLAVSRSFKNSEGEYDTDFIPCTLWGEIADRTAEYCEKGDVVGVKGRLQCLEGNTLQAVAEKVTFLSSRRKEEQND